MNREDYYLVCPKCKNAETIVFSNHMTIRSNRAYVRLDDVLNLLKKYKKDGLPSDDGESKTIFHEVMDDMIQTFEGR